MPHLKMVVLMVVLAAFTSFGARLFVVGVLCKSNWNIVGNQDWSIISTLRSPSKRNQIVKDEIICATRWFQLLDVKIAPPDIIETLLSLMMTQVMRAQTPATPFMTTESTRTPSSSMVEVCCLKLDGLLFRCQWHH